jgi:hypothetical protein
MDSFKIKSLLYKSGLNKFQMTKLLNYLGVPEARIVWRQDFNTYDHYLVVNLGSPMTGGTHFVAIDNIHKRYFDPLSMPPFDMVPDDYQYMPYGPQSVDEGHCGAYCALWLLYSKLNEVDQFYNLFNIANEHSFTTIKLS